MHAHAHHHHHASGASDCHGLHNSHGHHHAPADFGNAFLIGIGLNIVFVVIEGAAGLIYDSMALVADAGHNLSDVLALALAWIAAIAARRPPSGRFTYGYKSSTILAALANALLLAVAIGALLCVSTSSTSFSVIGPDAVFSASRSVWNSAAPNVAWPEG